MAKRTPPTDKHGNVIDAPDSVTPNLQAMRVTEKGVARDIPLVRQIREYELISPLFGGGTETKRADPVTVIRVPSIRGQLRFWWRAIRGGQFGGSLERMKEREDEIFGFAGSGDQASPSQVQIALSVSGSKGEDKPFEVIAGKPQPRKQSTVPAYAAFPLQPSSEEAKAGIEPSGVQTEVSFTIEVCFPKELFEEVNAAFWAWEVFGGIGARTRRGFGALGLKKINGKVSSPSKCNELHRFIEQGLQKHLPGSVFPDDVPHLSRAMQWKTTAKAANSNLAWKVLIDRLQQFRQYRKDKEGERSRFGKSQWPEPDAIRYRAETRGRPSIDKFPRAAFGLPINFHMHHDKFEAMLKGKTLDEGKAVERLASPLILRPFQCADGAVGIALILEAPRNPPGGLVLEMSGDKNDVVAELDANEARELTKRLEALGNNKDVLTAFLEFLG